MAIKVLNFTEQEFLNSTPKKLFKLIEIYNKVNEPSQKNKEDEEVYIDQL